MKCGALIDTSILALLAPGPVLPGCLGAREEVLPQGQEDEEANLCTQRRCFW